MRRLVVNRSLTLVEQRCTYASATHYLHQARPEPGGVLQSLEAAEMRRRLSLLREPPDPVGLDRHRCGDLLAWASSAAANSRSPSSAQADPRRHVLQVPAPRRKQVAQ